MCLKSMSSVDSRRLSDKYMNSKVNLNFSVQDEKGRKIM